MRQGNRVVNLESNYYAIGNRCTHMGCKLSEGMLKGESAQCPYHFSVFDVKTSNAVKGLAKKPVSPFQVKVEETKY